MHCITAPHCIRALHRCTVSQRHTVSEHCTGALYHNNTLYQSTAPVHCIDRLAHCSAAVRLWFLQNGLQLNADKELRVIGELVV